MYIERERDKERERETSTARRSGTRLLAAIGELFVVCLTRSSLFVVRTEFPLVALWGPEALDCRVLIPPEACIVSDKWFPLKYNIT